MFYSAGIPIIGSMPDLAPGSVGCDMVSGTRRYDGRGSSFRSSTRDAFSHVANSLLRRTCESGMTGEDYGILASRL